MTFHATVLVALVAQAAAFPFVANVPGVRSDLLPKRRAVVDESKRALDKCVFNPVHPGAVPINEKYPYLGAINGSKGTGKGGILVPTPGDTAHYYTAPGPLDIRGPCPGLNALANHNFISHDGITTFNELVDAQQNVYNLGQDLAQLLATAGVALDGDVVTGKLSLGCSADDRTNSAPGVTGTEPGLNGHNKFEADTSLTRNDFFLADGDNHSVNTTLFQQMADACKNNFNRENLSLYRELRYNQSRATNPDFFFGPGTLLMYGAASFLYRSFASFGGQGKPDLETMKSFFAISGDSGSFTYNGGERIPDNWHNVVTSYNNNQIGPEIWNMYSAHPVQFGANIGQAGNFNGMNYSTYITNGFINEGSAKNTMCLIYQLLTAGFPSEFSNVYLLPVDTLSFVLEKLRPGYANLGCPSPLYPSTLPVVS